MRSAEHPHVPVAVGPAELTRLAPVGRLVTADESAESAVLAELLIRIVGTMRLAAALEAAALTAPLLLCRRLPSTLRRAEGSRAERSELGCLLSRLCRGRPSSEVLLSRATLPHGAWNPTLGSTVHFGAFAGTSTTLEGLHRTSARRYVTLETTQRPRLREGS